MSTIDALKQLVDTSVAIGDSEKIKKQLELLGTLPGEYNEQVFDKLYELAKHDPRAITIFIDQFIETSVKLLNK